MSYVKTSILTFRKACSLLNEERTFVPSKKFRESSQLSDLTIYEWTERAPEAFLGERAKELDWMHPWERVLDWKPTNALMCLYGVSTPGFLLGAATTCLGKRLSPLRPKTVSFFKGYAVGLR